MYHYKAKIDERMLTRSKGVGNKQKNPQIQIGNYLKAIILPSVLMLCQFIMVAFVKQKIKFHKRRSFFSYYNTCYTLVIKIQF